MRTLPRVPSVRPTAPTFLHTRHPLIVGTALVLLLAGANIGMRAAGGGAGRDKATPTAADTIASRARHEAAREQVRAQLRSLVTAQEGWWSQHGTYTTDAAALGFFPRRAPQAQADSVSVQVVFAGGRGWSAIGTHRGYPGRSCVMYVGVADELPKVPATRAEKLVATAEGAPTCDAF